MNWDAISAIGELIGGFAVIVSILYLAVQVRISAKSNAAQSQRDTMDVFTFFAPLLEEENRAVFRKGLSNLNELTNDEKMHFHAMLHPLVSQYQAIHADHRAGIYDDEVYSSWKGAMVAVLSSNGAYQWWKQCKFVYSPSFQSTIDRYLLNNTNPSFIELVPYFSK